MGYSVRDVVTTAMRKLGIIRSGGVPSAGDAEDARLSLQSWYAECIDGGTFGRVWNIHVSKTGSVTPYPNQHVNVLTDDPVAAAWLRKASYSGRSAPTYAVEDIDMIGWQLYLTPEKAARGLHLMEYIADDLPDQVMDYVDLRTVKLFKRTEVSA